MSANGLILARLSANLAEWSETIVDWLIALLIDQAGVGPGIVAVVCESEGPGPQPVVHPQHGQAGPYAVARLHRDHARYLPGLVSRHQTWRGEISQYQIIRRERERLTNI